MTNPILSTHTWVSLSSEQRNRIRKIFNIPRSGSTEVRDGEIITDGTTTADFQHLTIEKMQEYLKDTSTDFHKLFDSVLARVQDEIEGKPIVINEPVKIEPEVVVPGNIINAKPKKNVKKGN